KPNLKFKLDSNLIDSEYIPLFASWIDKKGTSHYNRKSTPYKFKLLYRSDQNGFNATEFHKSCDDKGATIWITKIQDSTQLIGGYNPLDWNGNIAKVSKDSFLFNFTDGKNISTAKVGYFNDSNKLYCYNNEGPSMGNLYCPNSVNWTISRQVTQYPHVGIPDSFIVEIFEVFQIK
ncbi:19495_t:CDS:1, partial [Funneliformis geosporum]